MLSDLRESGAIEQDADIVSFIYRPEYYGITEDEDGNNTTGTGEIIIAKHRNGSLASVRLKFIAHLAKFANMDTIEQGGDPFASLGPNEEFDSGSRIVGSSMNDDFGAGSNLSDNDDDTPF
jgi:replicative DNA helicase